MNIETTNIDLIKSQVREALNTVAEQGRSEQLNQFANRPLSGVNHNLSSALEAIQPEQTSEFISDIQNIAQMMNRKIQFSMDYENSEMIVRIIDKETQEVIRQLPAEELRDLHRKLKESAEMLGFVIDAKA